MRKLDHKRQTFRVYGTDGDITPYQSHQRIWVMTIALVFVFFVFAWRLFHLQIVQGAYYRARSDNNRIIELRIPSARGVIYDRTGVPLITNHPVTQSLTTPKGVLLADGPTLTRDQVLLLESTSSGKIKTSIGRFYPYHKSTAHILGYVAEANEEDLETQTVVAGEMYGKSGLERQFNSVLTGIAGSEIIELDATGKILRQLPQEPPQPGTDLFLHLDIKLQQKLTELLAGRPGAAIASNPQTGAILALVSSPSFDPNAFGYLPTEMGINTYQLTDKISDLLTSESRPLVNRTISGAYPPASIYKVVTSIAALEKDAIQVETEIEDQGKITIDQYEFRNWYYTKYGGSDGMVNLKLALQRSNDIYYYQVGEAVGIDSHHLQAVKEGLIAACQSGGTGLPFFTYKLSEKNSRFQDTDQIACKTGTAQFYDKENRTHAWFSMFAPSENPEIMITILLEAAGEGSEQAAPVAKEALDFWLSE